MRSGSSESPHSGSTSSLQLALHRLDNVVGDLAAAVETLVDYSALLVQLREIIPVEVGEAALGGVGKIYIRKLAAR